MMNHRTLISFVILVAAFSGTNCGTGDDPASSPILLLANEEHFGRYTGEILRTEGFNNFRTESLKRAGITDDYLKEFDIVILTATSVTADEEKIFKDYVRGGGNLIA